MLRAELEKRRSAGGGGGAAARGAEEEANARRVHELTARAGQQQVQIDRQEQIILALRDQLQRQPAAPRDGFDGFTACVGFVSFVGFVGSSGAGGTAASQPVASSQKGLIRSKHGGL